MGRERGVTAGSGRRSHKGERGHLVENGQRSETLCEQQRHRSACAFAKN